MATPERQRSSQQDLGEVPGAPARRPGRKRAEKLRTGGVLAVAVLAILFAALNLREVRVDWILGSGHAPLIVVIVISVLAGIVITYLAERVNRRRR